MESVYYLMYDKYYIQIFPDDSIFITLDREGGTSFFKSQRKELLSRRKWLKDNNIKVRIVKYII